MKKCIDCGKELLKEQFSFDKSSGYYRKRCIPCFKLISSVRAKKYHEANRTKRLSQFKRKHEDNKQQTFEHYGNKCICCGEQEKLFLTIDHTNNDGYKYRRNGKDTSHQNIYTWLVANNYPKGFQVLCMNCNHGKHRNNGVCPHNTKD